LNILFILPEYFPHSGGGISSYYLHYIEALKPHCQKIKVVVGSGYLQSDNNFNLEGIEIESLKPSVYEFYLNKFSRFDLYPEFKKNLASAWAMYEQTNHGEGFDLIECTDFALGFIPWVIDRQRPVITRLHGSAGQVSYYEGDINTVQNDFVRQTELLMLPLSDCLVSHSSANKLAWETLLSKNIFHILPVFKVNDTQAIAFKDRYDFGVVTSRIQVWKGPIQLCEAASSLNNKISIRWYGRDKSYLNGESMSTYLKKRFPLIWGKTIVPQAALDIDEITEIQKKAKYGVVSSTWDMFNFTCIEYLAAGTPVICSDGAGASELINHGTNGFKYDARDPEKLADCIRQVESLNKKTFNEIAAAGRATITNELSAERVIPKNLELYADIIRVFRPATANIFIKHIYCPSDKKTDISGTLDVLPLKKLIMYLLKRISSKLNR
jgi:glycosyltransferase involved in cell wall biosynthesis